MRRRNTESLWVYQNTKLIFIPKLKNGKENNLPPLLRQSFGSAKQRKTCLSAIARRATAGNRPPASPVRLPAVALAQAGIFSNRHRQTGNEAVDAPIEKLL